MIPLLATERRWYCPNCGLEDQTTDARPHTRFHACPGLYGLTAPMLPAGTKAKVEAVERQDYTYTERVHRAENGVPFQSVVTTRDDGQDVVVFAPTAIGTGR